MFHLINHQLRTYYANQGFVQFKFTGGGEVKTNRREEFVSLEIQQKVVALLLKCKHISLLFAPLTNNKCQLKVDNDDEGASWFES